MIPLKLYGVQEEIYDCNSVLGEDHNTEKFQDST